MAADDVRYRRLAMAVAVAGVVSLGLGVVGEVLSEAPAREKLDLILGEVAASALGITGAVLAMRRPRNALLWIMAAAGTSVALSGALSDFESPSHALESSAAYVSNGFFFVGLALFVCFFPLLFPDGRLPGRRWRIPMWIGVAATVDAALWASLSFDPEVGPAYGPFGTIDESSPLAGLLGAGGVLVLVAVLAGLAALVVRYRRGGAEMRRRMRVPLVAVLLWLPFFVVINLLFETSIGEVFGHFVNVALPVLLTASLVVAVTRYGLYEIDRLVSRTVTCAIVVGALALLFAAGAVWLPQLLTISDSSLAVAAATLVVAALFNPLRRRVQRVVDRRFHRTRYDPEVVLSEMRTRLRNELDVARVGESLVAVSNDALEPATSAVWIRGRR